MPETIEQQRARHWVNERRRLVATNNILIDRAIYALELAKKRNSDFGSCQHTLDAAKNLIDQVHSFTEG